MQIFRRKKVGFFKASNIFNPTFFTQIFHTKPVHIFHVIWLLQASFSIYLESFWAAKSSKWDGRRCGRRLASWSRNPHISNSTDQKLGTDHVEKAALKQMYKDISRRSDARAAKFSGLDSLPAQSSIKVDAADCCLTYMQTSPNKRNRRHLHAGKLLPGLSPLILTAGVKYSARKTTL